MSNRLNDKFSKKSFKYLGHVLKISLIIYLILSFRKGQVEPAFWLMSVSLALAGLLSITTKDKEKFKYIPKDFIYATLFFIIAISAGGILSLFGEGVLAYHIFISGYLNLESIITGFTFGVYALVLIG